MKRWRAPKAKPGELLVKWGKEYGEEDLFFCHGGDGATKADGKLLIYHFNHVIKSPFFPDMLPLLKELEARGYDMTTLKFSIQKKKPNIIL